MTIPSSQPAMTPTVRAVPDPATGPRTMLLLLVEGVVYAERLSYKLATPARFPGRLGG
jgi:hypothetical protein